MLNNLPLFLCGDERTRTAVQQNFFKAFFMLSLISKNPLRI